MRPSSLEAMSALIVVESAWWTRKAEESEPGLRIADSGSG